MLDAAHDPPETADIDQALNIVAHYLATADLDQLLPIFLRLEREAAAHQMVTSALDRARRMAHRRAA